MVDPNFTRAVEQLDGAGRATARKRLLGIVRAAPGGAASYEYVSEKAYGGTPRLGPHDLRRALADAVQLGLIEELEGGCRLTEAGSRQPD